MSDAPAGPATTIVRSRVPDVVIPDVSVTDYIFRSAPDDADRVAIVDADDRGTRRRRVVNRSGLLDRDRQRGAVSRSRP